MRARTLLLLFLAVLLAGGTAILARSWITQKKEAEINAPAVPLAAPSKSVLVAKTDIKRGQILRPEDTVWQIWPEGGLDKNYIVLGGPPIPPRTPESFTGWVAVNPIAGGEPITDARVIAPGNRGFLAAVLRPGMRAISVPVTITSGISGFIFPGDDVDVLLTYSVPSSEKPTQGDTAKSPAQNYEHKAAETVLSAVRVIAVDQRLESKPGEAVPAHTATLEVTPKQSEIIVLASEIGKLSLSLRSLVPVPADGSNADTTTTGPHAAVTPVSATMIVPISMSAQTPTVVADRASGSSSAAPPTATQAGTAAPGRLGDSSPAPAPSGGARLVAPPAGGAPSTVGARATYTVDNEISTLLPQPKGVNADTEAPQLWICKGAPLTCTIQTGGSVGDRFLAAFQELKSQGAVFEGNPRR